ncbi:MAG: polymer-forming cytoskeletal protein [Acidimicrobiia bacterium]|nr:polymer-forming cytoskeletal protein [Acidimicrobiia bacterium]
MRFPSRALAVLVLAGAVLLPLPLRPTVINTNQYIVPEGDVFTEDVYAVANRAVIEGRIDGDLSFAGGDVVITGIVVGDLNVASSASVRIEGTIDGSVRGAAADRLEVLGTVTGDVAFAARSVVIEGEVGRDVLYFGAGLEIRGDVGRDIRGQMLTALIDGEIGNVVDIRVNGLEVGPSTVVGGEIIYRSNADASVSNQATLDDGISKFPATQRFEIELLVRAVTILGFLGFLVAGVLLFWLFRSTAPRAVAVINRRPAFTLGVGFTAVVGIPVLVTLLVATLVGIPVAVLVFVLYALGWLFIAPVPSVTVFGDRLLGGKRSLFAGFFVGAVLLRLVFWIPWVGAFVGLALFLSAVTWGFGGWLVAAWEQRATNLASARPLAPAWMTSTATDDSRSDAPPADWEPPLPPVG